MCETEYDCILLLATHLKPMELLVHCNLCYLNLRIVKPDSKLGEFFISTDFVGTDCVAYIHYGNSSILYIKFLPYYIILLQI
jgi:hypothetical protein